MSATVEELEALPIGAVVHDLDGGAWTKKRTFNQYRWVCDEDGAVFSDAFLVDGYGPVTILTPQDTDHSMCARLVATNRSDYPWKLVHPGGSWDNYTTSAALSMGYPISDTRPVKERVAEVLEALDIDDTPYSVVVERLAELGLLAQEGE